MQKLLKCFIKYPRYCEHGKQQFIEKLLNWAKVNIGNFEIKIEKTLFLLNIREILKIFFLLINSILLVFLFHNKIIHIYLTSLLIFFLFFPIQFRLVFLLLSMIIPSQNIIFSKKGSGKQKSKVIICAHYDTKNCITSSKKGIYKTFIKKNIYSITRLAGKYILLCQKTFLPIIMAGNLWYLINYKTTTRAVSVMFNYPSYPFSIFYNLVIIILETSVISSILMYVLSFSIVKKIKNPAADDNTSGVIGALEVAKRLNDINLSCDIKVVLFDNEEKGLIGSSHFVTKNLKELREKNTSVINLDCIGRGKSIYLLTDKKRNNNIYSVITNEMKKNDVEYTFSNMDYSDHKSFLKEGIDAISIGRYNAQKFLWYKNFPQIHWIHGCEDSLENIDVDKIDEIVNIIVGVIKKM